MTGTKREVIVVLGCRVLGGRPGSALERRLVMARTVSQSRPELAVIVSGGRKWDEVSESEAMAEWWTQQGTEADVIRENVSLTTFENAREVAKLCRALRVEVVHLVTCDFHMRRASRHFRNPSWTVIPHPAPSPQNGWLRFRAQLREWVADCLSPFESYFK